MYGGHRRLVLFGTDLLEVLHERLILEIAGQSLAHVLAKSILSVLEPKVASVGHRRPELLELRRSSCCRNRPFFERFRRNSPGGIKNSTKKYEA